MNREAEDPSIKGLELESGTVAVLRRRVTMGDVDAVQIYAPTYFRWMDQGAMELWAQLGHPLSVVLAEGFGAPAVRASCEYLRPVFLDEIVESRTFVSRVGRASYDLEHLFFSGGRQVARGRMTHVFMQLGGKPRPLEVPSWLREALVVPPSDHLRKL